MKISREAKRIARGLLDIAKPNDRLDAARVRQIADTLVAEKPRAYYQILQEFTRLIRLEVEKRHATVASATTLDAAATQELDQKLRAQFGGDITTEFVTDSSLIGGVRVRLGSDVWDGSIRARLDSIREKTL